MYKVVNLKWNEQRKANVCCHCESHTKTVFIATSHDHTDETFDLCCCGNGVDFKTAFNQVINATYSIEEYKEYLN